MAKPDYDFSGLTEAQQRVLTFQGWQIGDLNNQPLPSTCRKLIERGLLIAHEEKRDMMIVREYRVPVAVHMAWCAECERRALASPAGSAAGKGK